MSNSKIPFGRIPCSLSDEGILQCMKGSDARVYLALATFINRKTWECWPGINRIANAAGLDVSTVFKAIKRLENLGAIKVRKGGGRGNCNVYSLMPNTDCAATVSCGQTVASQPRNTGRSASASITKQRKEHDDLIFARFCIDKQAWHLAPDLSICEHIRLAIAEGMNGDPPAVIPGRLVQAWKNDVRPPESLTLGQLKAGVTAGLIQSVEGRPVESLVIRPTIWANDGRKASPGIYTKQKERFMDESSAMVAELA